MDASRFLLWNETTGIGFCPVDSFLYDEAYFEEYCRREKSPIAASLNEFRLRLVNAFAQPEGLILDIGIGAGTFIRLRGNAFGYDVCPPAVAWLKQSGLFVDPYAEDLSRFQAITFFDSFEHIYRPAELLGHIGSQAVVLSIPIFLNHAHVLRSKHFKPREHYWYFTSHGLKIFMDVFGFSLLYESFEEETIGREDIGTFVFKRERR